MTARSRAFASPAASAFPRPRRCLARERIEQEAGRRLSDRELEKLIDQVIVTNQERI
jgi:hypothetical protein